MKVIETETIVYFDVDETLVLSHNPKNEKTIKVINPYDGLTYLKLPHYKHVELLKQYKGRGFMIVVWSAAGYKWAESVVKALQLEDFVDYVQTKPIKIVDDLTPNEVFQPRIYLNP